MRANLVNVLMLVMAFITMILTALSLPPLREFLERSRKIEIAMSRPLTVIDTTSRDGPPIEIRYNDRNLPNFTIFTIKVENTGAYPITSYDYDEQVQLQFENTSRIISVENIESNPNQMQKVRARGVNPDGLKPFIELPKPLLNPNDSYILEVKAVLDSGKKPEIKQVTGRIAGVKQIEYKETTEQPKRETFQISNLALLAMLVTLILSIIGNIKLRSRLKIINPSE